MMNLSSMFCQAISNVRTVHSDTIERMTDGSDFLKTVYLQGVTISPNLAGQGYYQIPVFNIIRSTKYNPVNTFLLIFFKTGISPMCGCAYRKYSLTYAKIMHTLYAYSGDDFMRTTLNISDKLIEDLHRFSQEKSKTRAVSIAIEDYIKRKKIERLLSLSGKINIDYDWKKEEEREAELEKQEKKG